MTSVNRCGRQSDLSVASVPAVFLLVVAQRFVAAGVAKGALK